MKQKKWFGTLDQGKEKEQENEDEVWETRTQSADNAHCHCHCRKGLRITKDCEEFPKKSIVTSSPVYNSMHVDNLKSWELHSSWGILCNPW